MPLRTSHLSRKELCLFTRQLATILKAGIPLLSALTTLKTQTNSPSLKQAIERTRARLLDGDSLAAGLAATPAIFDRLYISLVSSGERAGILDQTLATLSQSLERGAALRSRMLRAAIYPALVLTTLCVVTVFLLCWVIPTFEDLFQESGVQLPWLTQAVLGISRQTISYWSYLVAFFGCLFLSASWAQTRSHTLNCTLERIALRTPLIAGLVRARLASEFSSLVAALLNAGIPIIEALDIAAETIQHFGLSKELCDARDSIREGATLTDSLKRSTVLPAMVWQMVGVGEASGQVPQMLTKVGTLFEQEVDAATKTLQDLAEPALIILIGLVVGTLVVAIYLPLFQLGEVSGAR